jgi:hypothetical protein
MDRRVDILIATPRPEARLQFADGGLEWLVRYPVEIRKALPMRTSKPPSQARRKFGLSRVSDSHHCLASRSTGHISSPEIPRDQHHSET